MSRRILHCAVLLLVSLAGAAGWWWQGSGRQDRVEREARVAFAAPHWTPEQVKDAVNASDSVPPIDGRDVRSLLAGVEVDARDVQAFHAANLDAFGGRPYSDSHLAAEQLWRVHLVRRQLGIAPPENGLVYP